MDLNRITLQSWDWIVIALFFGAMIWIVWDVFRKKKLTSGDYFLDGRSATWIAIGASIFASNIGSEHLIGLAGTGASAGMAQAHWEIQGWMILILGWVFVPFYQRSMVYTMPEFLEKRYNKESRGILTYLSLASYVLTKVSVTVMAGGLALNALLGINFWVAALALVIITAIYTVIGGMESVLKTSVCTCGLRLTHTYIEPRQGNTREVLQGKQVCWCRCQVFSLVSLLSLVGGNTFPTSFFDAFASLILSRSNLLCSLLAIMSQWHSSGLQ